MVALWISYAFGFTNLADQTAIRVLGLRPLNDVYIVVFKSIQFKHRTSTITPTKINVHMAWGDGIILPIVPGLEQ